MATPEANGVLARMLYERHEGKPDPEMTSWEDLTEAAAAPYRRTAEMVLDQLEVDEPSLRVLDAPLDCQYAGCGTPATRIMALPTLHGEAVAVMPYCDTHAVEVGAEQNAKPASGSALSPQARRLEGNG